jgi:hypothetical protein
MALSANLNYVIYKGDVRDAYAHSPGPETPTFIRICDQFADWYRERKGTSVNRSHVIPLLRALQGHPEAGRLWEEHINGILLSPDFGFKNTTHETNIYQGTFHGTKVLMLRQVDDFLLASPTLEVADEIFTRIGTLLQQPNEADIPSVNKRNQYQGMWIPNKPQPKNLTSILARQIENNHIRIVPTTTK